MRAALWRVTLNMRPVRGLWAVVTDVVFKTGSTLRITTPPDSDRATSTGMHEV